jgi:S-DNA-T family DNA segregation ATPase FtsK/SpoIIIE
VQVEISAAACGGEQDVRIDAPDDTLLSEVLPLLALRAGADAAAPAWHDGRLLGPAQRLAECGLRVGSIVHFGARPDSPAGAGVLSVQVVGGPAAGLARPVGRGRIVLGRADGCDLVLPDPDVSRRHAAVEVTDAGITLHDLGSTNGVRVEAERLPPGGSAAVTLGALCTVGESVFTVAGPAEAPATTRAGRDGTTAVLRPPRHPHVVAGGELALPNRPTGARARGVQWLGALVPAAGGAAIAWYAHAPQYLLFALLSPLMILSTSLGDRLHWRRSRRRAAATYRQRRAAVDDEVAERLAAETATRRGAAPDPVSLARQAALPGSRLWERRRGDGDVLRVRLGLTERPATLLLRDGPECASAGTLRAVPLCVDLRAGPLGVAGPPAVVAALGRWIVGQLAVLHAPADLEIAFVLDPAHAGQWQWARWLPHLRGRVATSDDEAAALLAETAALVEARAAGRRGDARWIGPWLVLVVDGSSRRRELPGLAAILHGGASVGIGVVCLDVDAAALPARCAAVGVAAGPTGTRIRLRSPDAPGERTALLDQVGAQWASTLARDLAPLCDAGSATSELPASCTLADICGRPDPTAAQQLWAASDGAARAVLGAGHDGPLEIDLATEGPHALIAGMTGSGKSELLRTLVAGLAANHPPDELTLLLVDYKGGAAFAQCAALPHVAGVVTDLDPYLTERALRALGSELRRRERLFAEAGADELTGYRRAGGPALARLVIVVDEFAALAEELPSFLRGLVATAQRGRSLGVHLVLATQRPGAAVSADIRANTALRIALRVADPAESSDIIGDPSAATLQATHPGRAYLRSGTELDCFQAAHASAAPPADLNQLTVTPLGSWRRGAGSTVPGADTQLARHVAALREAAARSGRRATQRLWLAPLPEALPRGDLELIPSGSVVALGRLDLPDEQRSPTWSIDFDAAPALLVSGTARSGRTGALTTLALGAAERLGPQRLQLYLVDASGALCAALRRLPHCATALGPYDAQLLPRLLHRLAALPAAAPQRPAATRLLLVDGWETLCAGLSDLDAARCAELLAGLLRLGPAAGLAIAVAGDRATLSPRFAGAFGERVVLRLADHGDYTLAGIAARTVPAHLPPGRGVHARDGTLVQFAHAGPHPGAVGDAAAAEAVRARWVGARVGADAVVIRPLPPTVRLAELIQPPGRLCLGVAGDRAEQVALDPFAGAGRVLVAGPPRSGRSTLLRVLARQAHAAGIATLVAATARSPLAAEANALGLTLVGPNDQDGTAPPAGQTLLLVDDGEAFTDTVAGRWLTELVRAGGTSLATVVAGRSDELATDYRGLGAEVRRSRCGILLRPGPIDGELLGLRLPRGATLDPPGRGVAVGDASWGPQFTAGEPVPIQVATP